MSCTSSPASEDGHDRCDHGRAERRTQKRKRVRKNDGRLKRPINSFLLFAKEYRPVLLQEHGKLNNQEVSKLLGIKWKSMAEEEKAPYTMEAEAIHAKFMLEHPDFSWHGAKDGLKLSSKKRSRTSSVGPMSETVKTYHSPATWPSLPQRRCSYGDLSTGSATQIPLPQFDTTPSTGKWGDDSEEVIELGGLDQAFSIWCHNKPVPAGFRLVYLPLLVPENSLPSEQSPFLLPHALEDVWSSSQLTEDMQTLLQAFDETDNATTCESSSGSPIPVTSSTPTMCCRSWISTFLERIAVLTGRHTTPVPTKHSVANQALEIGRLLN
jgi:hypothetical protein